MMMVRRKGERSKREIDRDWPYQVRILIPGTGHPEVPQMRAWTARHGGTYRAERQLPHTFSRYCFRTPEAADGFHQAFEGERIDTLPKDAPAGALRRSRR